MEDEVSVAEIEELDDNDSLVEKEEKLTSDSVLNSYGNTNLYQIWVFLAMACCWCYIAPPALLAPFALGDMCVNTTNCNVTEGSIIQEFNLIGEDAYKAEMALSINILGNLFGSTVLSKVADEKGRRPVLLFCMFSFGICNLFSAFAPNIFVLACLWMLRGVFSSGLGTVNWVLGYESASFGLRSYFPMIFGYTWVFGYVAVAPLAYYIHYWRYQVLVSSIPSLIAVAVYYFTVPESFHVCVSKGRNEDVKKWYTRMNSCSKVKRGLEEADELIEQHKQHIRTDGGAENKDSLWTALRKNRAVQLYMFVFAYTWTVDFFIYAGLNIISTALAGNKYWNFALTGLAEIPSYIVSPYLLDKLGRRGFGIVSHFLTFFAFISAAFIQNPTLSFVFWLFGKFAISCAFTAMFVYVSEVFPTAYRSGCIGICMCISCFGGLATGGIRAVNEIHPNLPNLIFALAALVASALTILLPETRGNELPDTTEEMEQLFRRNRNQEVPLGP
ncbi:unnamed protein product [Bursaphelenchus xylophilus]|uniref:(pine wood nematode) hypothetical protein n=1 Tax=Bursaphelenchus xylophilus TaxID=6326 RepID=A0A1I7RXT5_BURXY|nr:unnamed protein product [Bursaphelenchus xylophilus]CAG9125149.1 unnamed protein product [Bursaphelenchus xylophilus]